MIAKVRIYTASDRKTVVEGSDKRAAFLLFPAGSPVTVEEKQKFSIPDEMLEEDKKSKVSPSPGPDHIGARIKRVPDVPSKR